MDRAIVAMLTSVSYPERWDQQKTTVVNETFYIIDRRFDVEQDKSCNYSYYTVNISENESYS